MTGLEAVRLLQHHRHIGRLLDSAAQREPEIGGMELCIDGWGSRASSTY